MADRRVKQLLARIKRERAAREKAETLLAGQVGHAAQLEAFHRQLENFPAMIWQRVAYPDGHVEIPFVSGSIREILGIPREELDGNPTYLRDLIHPDDRDRYLEEYEASRQSMQPAKLEVRIRTKNNDYTWVHLHGAPRELENGAVQWDVVATDISNSKEAVENLRGTDAQYREIFEKLPTAVYVDYGEEIVFVNNSACTMFGAKTADELIGRSAHDLYAPEMRKEVIKRRKDCLAGEEAPPTLDSWLIRLDGTPFFAETLATPISWKDDTAVLVVLHDITERKQAERLSDAARRAAEDANRAKSDFLASMSHELRTPLNGVLGTANLLLDGRLDLEQHERVEVIRQSGGALLSLLNDILDISKVESGRLELEDIDFALKDLLDTVADLWAPQAESKGLSFVREEAEMPFPILRSDPARIRQILFNLISNALKFTESGSITVRVSQSEKGGGFVETSIDVIDTGTGIPPDRVERIFDKFVQADSSITRKYGGSGLGLSLCKSFAAALNGNIGVESTVGEGSTFWFRIICPVGDEAKVAEAALGGRSDGPDGDRQLRILVAEDNLVNQTVIVAMLKKAGHEVDLANNGTEAVSAVMRSPYDVVLMDIQMPEMDGITATKRIREHEADGEKLPIIALTANAMTGDREEYLAAGMNDYVSKPIDPADLATALRRQCGEDVATQKMHPVAAAQVAETAAPAEDDQEDLQDELNALFEQM